MKFKWALPVLVILALVAIVPASALTKVNKHRSHAVVRWGEGVESPLIRQFQDRPAYFGFTGDVSDTDAVKNWAGTQAELRAIQAGKKNWKFGEEVRVKAGDEVAYVLAKNANGSLEIHEESADAADAAEAGTATASVDNSKIVVTQIACSVASSVFAGTPGHETIHSYEYLYPGIEG